MSWLAKRAALPALLTLACCNSAPESTPQPAAPAPAVANKDDEATEAARLAVKVANKTATAEERAKLDAFIKGSKK